MGLCAHPSYEMVVRSGGLDAWQTVTQMALGTSHQEADNAGRL